ncbi:hypothetical protein SRB521_00280 [Intestinimonas butyriciproducens]|nr:hypothetical protein SRB521_00280 [Intestinimonas butyriciproducens]
MGKTFFSSPDGRRGGALLLSPLRPGTVYYTKNARPPLLFFVSPSH